MLGCVIVAGEDLSQQHVHVVGVPMASLTLTVWDAN